MSCVITVMLFDISLLLLAISDSIGFLVIEVPICLSSTVIS